MPQGELQDDDSGRVCVTAVQGSTMILVMNGTCVRSSVHVAHLERVIHSFVMLPCLSCGEGMGTPADASIANQRHTVSKTNNNL